MDEKFLQITNAVYKLLEFFPENEPLKNRAKEKALSITENLVLIFGEDGWTSISSLMPQRKEKAIINALEDIEILLSFLKVGKQLGWISNINLLIIEKEYEKLKEEIKKTDFKKERNIEKISFSEFIEKTKIIPPLKESKPKADNLSERQKKILQLLKEREKTQVSDIIKVLPNITKRTIRRDLDDLLKKDKIARVGEWNQVFYKVIEQ